MPELPHYSSDVNWSPRSCLEMTDAEDLTHTAYSYTSSCHRDENPLAALAQGNGMPSALQGFDPPKSHVSIDSYGSSDEDEEEGEDYEAQTSARRIMIALESLAPKLAPHIWVVQQKSEGVLEVFTPNTFEEFLAFATPSLSRGHFRAEDGAEPCLPVSSPKKPPVFHWADMQNLSDHEIRALGSVLVLHELTVEDMIANDSPEKLEVFEDLEYQYSMLSGQWPDQSRSSGWKDVRLSCLTLAGWFITIHKQPFVGLDEMLRRVRKDFSAMQPNPFSFRYDATHHEHKQRSPDHHQHAAKGLGRKNSHRSVRRMNGVWLYYSVFDVLVDAMIPRASHIWENANQVDELILQLWGSKEPEMDDTTRIMARCRKHINDVRRSISAKEAIIKEHRLYRLPEYRDVLDHVQQMLDRLDSARDVLAQANSNYLAGVSVQAAIGANSTNEVMKRMSILAFVFVPMTLITSLFGMNVRVPWQDEKSTTPFWMILSSFFVFVGLAVALWFARIRPARVRAFEDLQAVGSKT